MSRISVNRVNQDELIYELTIQGRAIGDCCQMRKSLSNVLSLNTPFIDPCPFSLDDEVKAIRLKLETGENFDC